MTPAAIKAEISFEDFEKLDIRVGTILSVADVSASKKLVKSPKECFLILATQTAYYPVWQYLKSRLKIVPGPDESL